ncbi:AAA domain-containing protein [Hirsutella rhossiliensis]|uniref:AAA domain-containing protein n=1 Tax=Hirsutella rhossiliensis TaxID=111463 RepID=A0A9P8N850_9HYPO|nr:AAA domain-containing protein [Hirsutella rhossiliensis]KAH0968732.1 AAA domain-containing protein [Hirsutella rhossiliensis]
MDEIHISWQGAVKPTPSDLSSLLSVRRRVVERALVWLKRNNPHYAEIEIDAAEMESWGESAHGVPPSVYGRLERNEPSAWEKTRTAHIVPPTERAMDDEGAVEIEEVLSLLNQGGGSATILEDDEPESIEVDEARGQSGDEANHDAETINEVTSSGMFALDGPPDVADVDKLRFACDAVREGRATTAARVRGRRGTADIREQEAATRELVSSRNMSLRTWADTVLRRHGGRFATHHIFAFLVFNIGVRSRNRRVSMLSVTRKNFRKVERIVRSLTADGLAAARAELESTGKTTDDAVKELLRSLSLYGVPRARPEAAEEFLRSLDKAFKRVRLSVSDPMSSAVFFHREMTLFFEHYVNAGGESVFGRVSQYYGAVKRTSEAPPRARAALARGNAHLSSMLADSDGGNKRHTASESSATSIDLDQEGFCAVEAERSVTSDISSLLDRADQFSASFEEEANFCAGATQIHTHSPTCVKYSLGSKGRKGADLCRFKAPWERVEETTLSADGVLRIRRTHPMRKTMALVYYVTNYATKVEDPTWKRVAAAAELLPVVSAGSQPGAGDDTRQFLMRVANRVFTERALSQVEVVAHLLGHPSEFSGSSAWAYLNVSVLYWHVSRLWRHLRQQSGTAAVEDVSVADESVVVEQAGERISFAEAYHHRGHVLRGLCLYDYVSLVRLQRVGKAGCSGGSGGWVAGKDWVQVLRRPGKYAVVCLDGYLSKDFEQDDEESAHRRAAVQHLALFVPWEAFLGEGGDINEIWRRARAASAENLVPRRQRSTAPAVRRGREARRQAVGGLGRRRDCAGALGEAGRGGGDTRGRRRGLGVPGRQRRKATRLIDVVRSAAGANQITAGSRELSGMIQQLCRFQQSALASTAELEASIVRERGGRRIDLPGRVFSGAAVPPQDQVKAIKSQQTSASRRGEDDTGYTKHGHGPRHRSWRGGRSVLTGFGEEGVQITAAEAGETAGNAEAGMEVRLGPSTSFLEAGKGLTRRLTLNKKQAIAFSIICRHLDSMRQGDGGDVSQLCQFVGGEGGTGKSRVIEALVGLFAAKGISSRLLITATSGTAAARVNGITIHSACGFTKDQGPGANTAREVDGVRLPRQAERFVDGESRMDWQDKEVLVIDEVSMLGARTLHAFRPVQERSILLPSSAVSWDEDYSFRAEQRHQHDKAHALWKRFTTVVMLDEQMRAAGDPELQRLLKRIRLGVQDHTDLDLLNSRCYREGRRIPFQMQRRLTIRIFISEHKWKEGLPTEEEAIMMLNQGDDSATPVPGVFMFVAGMPVVVNHNTHQGLKLVNGASYTAAEVIVDKVHPAHRISADMAIHFGPPAAIILGSETTKDFHFVGMPPGTILLTPMSVRIQCHRKRPWQQKEVTRKGLPCAAAFACTDYKVQGGTLERVALELRGTRTTNVGGHGIMLISEVRERDFVGNRVPREMTAAQARLEELSDRTVREALRWLGDDFEYA